MQEDLESALEANIGFSGTHAWGTSYAEFPNPCIELDGIGLISLPMTEAVAKSVISHATQASFGHNESRIVDKDVRDTWEIEPHKLKFLNPAWTTFIDGINDTICTQLGVAPSSVAPRCELYKLLIHETGSQ